MNWLLRNETRICQAIGTLIFGCWLGMIVGVILKEVHG